MNILFACGGTGGHINPAIAVAGYIKSRNPDAVINFVGNETGMESRLVPAAGYNFYPIHVSGFERKLTPHNLKNNVKSFKRMFTSGFEAGKIISQLDPEKLVEPGSVAEHIGNADQTDPRTGKCQLRFELEHHGGQLLQGHTDLDHRQLDALLDDPSLHTAGHDQVTALPFQLSGPALSLARLDVFQGHERDGWECPDKGLCQVAQLLAGHFLRT